MLKTCKFFRNFLTYTSVRRITTEAEIDDRLFNKGPLDPLAVELVKRHESSIIYSSYVERNKKPLRYRELMMMRQIAEKQKNNLRLYGAGKPFSLALRYIDKNVLNESVTTDEVTSKQQENVEKLDEKHDEDMIEEFLPTRREILINESKLEILKEMKERRMEFEVDNEPKYPPNWMEDYETYDESIDVENDLVDEFEFGTSDPKEPVSRVPCHGCGAMLHCADQSLPGYLPSELFRKQPDHILRRLICQRCHFLKNYNTALKVKVGPEDYVQMISAISDKRALAVIMVDLMDFPCSIWPGIVDIIGTKRPVFIVGNKVDLLPQDSHKYLDHVRNCLEKSVIDAGLTATNIKHTCLISAETNYGVEDLITNLHNVWACKGDIYLVGCTNVGKSTLFNALLKSDLCKSKASNIIKRVTASIWPGTTMRMLKFPILRPSQMVLFERMKRLHSENRKLREDRKLLRDQAKTGQTAQTTLIGHIGRTFTEKREDLRDAFTQTEGVVDDLYIDENNRVYKDSRWFFDTPGVVLFDQIINILTVEELMDVVPKKVLLPRVFLVKPGWTLFLAGLGRIDYISGADKIRLTVFASDKLPILIVKTKNAEQVYNDCLGTELMKVPRGDQARLNNWPKLEKNDEDIKVSGIESEHKSACDILLSSAGWVSVNLPESEIAKFQVWTPARCGIHVRKPSLLPYAMMEYRGKRIRESPAYNLRLPKRVTF